MHAALHKINPQIGNFRVAQGASIALFDTVSAYVGNVLPPVSWDVDDLGRTILPACGPGQWLSGIDSCNLCPENTFKNSDDHEYLQKNAIYKRGGVCHECPANSVSAIGSTSSDECLCNKGYFMDSDKVCEPCGIGTFKDTFSNTDKCTKCNTNYKSRTSSTEYSDCIDSSLSGTHQLYKKNLGTIYQKTNVEPNWISTPPNTQNDDRLCVFTADGKTLDCGGGELYTGDMTAPFYTNDNKHDKISLLQRPGYMGPGPQIGRASCRERV